MRSDNLKPCPFCGGEAEIKTIGNDVLLSTHRLTANSRIKCGTIIKCSNWECAIEVRVYTLCGPISQTRIWAFERWNTRAESVNHELIERVKFYATRLHLQNCEQISEYRGASGAVSMISSELEDARKEASRLRRVNQKLLDALKNYRSNHKSAGSDHFCAHDPLWPDYICEQCNDADKAISEAEEKL